MDGRQVRYDQDLVTQLDPLSQVSEAFKIARTNIEFSSIDHPAKLIAITSSNQSEGKTVTIANLAITYAQIGRRVLLIDADLRRPTVHHLFGLSNRRGLTNALLSKAPYTDYVLPTQTENLSIIPSGPIPPNPAEILMSESMNRILAECRSDFDLVLIDSPPVGVVTDGAIIASKVDGVVYVIRAGMVDRRQLKRSISLLGQVKAKVLGYIFNGINESNDAYYYTYYQQTYLADQLPSGRRGRKRARKAAKKAAARRDAAMRSKQPLPVQSQSSPVRKAEAPAIGRQIPIPQLDDDPAKHNGFADSAQNDVNKTSAAPGLVSEDD